MGRSSGGQASAVYGRSILPDTLAVTAAEGAYQDIGVSVTLPQAGLYRLDASLRAKVSSTGDSWVAGRLFNVTDGAEIPDSEVMGAFAPANSLMDSQGATTVFVSVQKPTTIRLEVGRWGPGWTTSDVFSNWHGRTSLSYRLMKE